MAKARDAFRTISEVSDWLDTPAHVLRFWESKFAQVKPVKRAGGRRYYRPEDMQLLGGIKILLHEQGMTIKGAQKLMREQGVKHVAALSPDPTASAPEVKAAMPPPAQAPAAEPAPVVPADVEPPAPAPVTAAPAAAPDPTPVADNVTPLTAMPPPTAPAEPVNTPAAPAATAPEPALPREAKTPAEPRIFAALRDASDDRLRAKAAQIAPLVARLQDVRDRMRQS